MRYPRLLYTVFKKPSYLLLATLIAWMVFTVAVWLPNIPLILTVLGSSATFSGKFMFLVTLYESIGTNFTVISATYTISIAILVGIQISLLYYYIRKVKTNRSSLSGIKGTGLAGLLVGFLGIGCAACGAFILTSLLSLIGASALLTFLPFGGGELGFLGVILLVYSTWLLLKKINEPLVCIV